MFRPIAVCGLLLFALLPISAKAQIEIFGLSFAMTPVETMRYLDDRGLAAYLRQDEQRFCFQKDTWGEVGKYKKMSKYFVNEDPGCTDQYPSKCECLQGYCTCTPSPYLVNCFNNGTLSPRCEESFNRSPLVISKNKGTEIPAASSETSGITVGYERITFQCRVYNGCDFDLDEVVEFFNENVGDQLQTRLKLDYRNGIYGRVKAYCARGHKLDELCVLEGAYGGNSVQINRDAFGSGGMSLTLN